MLDTDLITKSGHRNQHGQEGREPGSSPSAAAGRSRARVLACDETREAGREHRGQLDRAAGHAHAEQRKEKRKREARPGRHARRQVRRFLSAHQTREHQERNHHAYGGQQQSRTLERQREGLQLLAERKREAARLHLEEEPQLDPHEAQRAHRLRSQREPREGPQPDGGSGPPVRTQAVSHPDHGEHRGHERQEPREREVDPGREQGEPEKDRSATAQARRGQHRERQHRERERQRLRAQHREAEQHLAGGGEDRHPRERPGQPQQDERQPDQDERGRRHGHTGGAQALEQAGG